MFGTVTACACKLQCCNSSMLLFQNYGRRADMFLTTPACATLSYARLGTSRHLYHTPTAPARLSLPRFTGRSLLVRQSPQRPAPLRPQQQAPWPRKKQPPLCRPALELGAPAMHCLPRNSSNLSHSPASRTRCAPPGHRLTLARQSGKGLVRHILGWLCYFQI